MMRSIERVGKRKLLTCLLALLPLSPLQAQASEAQQPLWGKCSSPREPAQGRSTVPAAAAKSTVSKLADNVYVFRSPYFENSLIIVGNDGVLITDTFNDAHAPLLKEEIKKITDKPVTKIVLSHEHFDHVGGTQYFPGAELIAQQSIVRFLAFDPLGRAPDKVDVTFEDELTIDMGTTQVELKYWGQTEGVANIVVHLPREKIALLSDLHQGGRSLTSFLSLSDTNMLGLRLVLNEVSKWDLKYVVDSHTHSTDPAMMREYAGFLNDLYDAVYVVVKKDNETADPLQLWRRLLTVPDSIQLSKYKDWDGYDQEIASNALWMAASIVYGAL